ncbi:hypothetical protein yc1106_06640 [Curvularia clavata]|uniref:DEAD/DEAH-box helicase domain-containing protein n=1 Tax=Curvularia clavata TaxID=95742 RepID=A0A9Q8ZBW1_CURCL|nr:hypothetical protein yc1106_06640 [Curvularia clavata]
MVQATSQEPWLRNWAESADQVMFPRPDAAPLPHMPVYTDGLKCWECGYICRHVKKMQEHGRNHHNWTGSNTRRVGRPAAIQQRWTDSVICQKFQNTGTLGRLFEVQSAAPAEPADSDDGETQLRRAFTTAITQIDQVIESKKASNVVEEDGSRWGFEDWLERAGWVRHLKGLDRLWLLDMALTPSYHERALQDVCWAAEMVIWRAQQVSHSSVVGMPAIMHINRREYGTKTNEKPFNASQMETTMKKYRSLDSSNEVQGRRPPYRLTSEQKACLEELKDLTGYNPEEEAASTARSIEPGGSYGEDSDSEDEQLDAKYGEALQDQVLAFMLALLDYKLPSIEFESGFISGMAVLGVSADRGWLDAPMYTPKQSAVVAISRMLVLYQAHKERTAKIDKLVASGYSKEAASRIAPTHLELVQDMGYRFMFNTNAEGVIDWVGDTLLYGQIQFSMAQLRTMVHGMIASTRQDMLKQLLLLELDSEGEVVPGTTPCPAIYWDKLVDNAAQRQAGWSFMEDARNHQATSAQDPKRWLVGRVQQEKRLRHEFADAAASRVAMAGGGGLVWVKERIRAYYKAMQQARHALANPKARKAYLNADEDDAEEEEDEAFDLQTGHGSRVAGAIYGRSLNEAAFSVESKRFMFRVSSSEWHRFLELPSVQEKKLQLLQRSPLAVKARREALEEEYRRWKMMRLVDVDSELQRLLGCNAQFRSVQRPAMQAIMRYESPVVAIMGTGAGKSVLFMLPASVSTGVTVVVVPLVALRFDMKTRCDELGIVSGEWDSRRPYRSV